MVSDLKIYLAIGLSITLTAPLPISYIACAIGIASHAPFRPITSMCHHVAPCCPWMIGSEG